MNICINHEYCHLCSAEVGAWLLSNKLNVFSARSGTSAMALGSRGFKDFGLSGSMTLPITLGNPSADGGSFMPDTEERNKKKRARFAMELNQEQEFVVCMLYVCMYVCRVTVCTHVKLLELERKKAISKHAILQL